MALSLEEILLRIEHKAAAVRFAAECAATSPEIPDGAVWNGFGAVCSEIEGMASCARHGLTPDVLSVEPRARTAR